MNITDGTAVFAVGDKRMQALVDIFYPVGAIFFCSDSTKTKDDFEFMQYGTWEELPSARCIETADATHNAGTTIAAGLPNITGTYDINRSGCSNSTSHTTTGAFSTNTGSLSGAEGNWKSSIKVTFDASKSNSIYGASSTVQPPAYFVKAWRRTA